MAHIAVCAEAWAPHTNVQPLMEISDAPLDSQALTAAGPRLVSQKIHSPAVDNPLNPKPAKEI